MTCTATGEVYIGSSVDIGRRCRQHKNAMRKGVHTSSKMQQRWNEYPESFAYTVIYICGKSEMIDREQDFIDRFRPELNAAPYASSSRGFKMTPEQRSKMRDRPQSRITLHPFRGEMLSVPQIAERTRLSIPGVRVRLRKGIDLNRPTQKGAPEPIDINGEWLTPREIADKFALPLTTVYSRLGRGWTGARLTEPRKHRARFSR